MKIFSTFLLLPSLLTMADSEQFLSGIVESNPEIIAAEASMNTGQIETRIENNLPDTEIEVGQEWGNLNAGNKLNVSVTQGFDWPGMYVARSARYRALVTANQARLASMKADMMAEARGLLIDIAAQQLTNNLLERISSGLDLMLEGAVRQYETASITILDLNKIRIEAANASLALTEGTIALDELLTRLAAMSGSTEIEMPKFDNIPYAELPLLDLQTYIDAAVSDSNPARQSALATGEYVKAGERVARMSRAPGFALGYDYEREGGVTFHGFHVGLNLPVFSSRGRVAAAQAASTEADLEAANIDTGIIRAITYDYRLAESLKHRLDTYGPAVALSDNIGLLKSAFDRGALELTHYLSDLNYFLAAQRQYIDLQRAYIRQLVALNRFVAPELMK